VQLSDSTIIETEDLREFTVFRIDHLSDVRFCDGCAEVSTGAERARRHYDRTVSRVQAQVWPH
jgi:hypothetical protein